MKMMAQYGIYQCAHCGDVIRWEPVTLSEDQPYAIGACQNDAAYSNITGELLRQACPRAGVRLKIKVDLIEAEEVP